jgi:hypothetical protein
MDDSLKYQAETLGIKVDGRWSDERLQKEIDEALAKAPETPKPAFGGKGDHDGDGKPGGAVKAAKSDKLIPVHVNRDFWDENGERVRKGTIVEVAVEVALDGVENGSLSRVK